LLTELVPDAEKARAEFMTWAAEGREKPTAMGEVGSRAHSIIAHSRIYDGRTIPSLNHHEQALKTLQQERPLSLPSQFLAELEAEEGEQGE
jgi:hypothetical protein